MPISLINEKKYKILLVFLIFICCTTRGYLLERHFTHLDDIGVAWTILHFKNEMASLDNNCNSDFIKSISSCRLLWANNKAQELSTPSSKLGSLLEKYNFLDTARFLFFYLKSYNIVSYSWTYAPLQFYLTDILLSTQMSYSQIKLWGRFPSFIFSILAIIISINLAKYISPKNSIEYAKILISILMITSIQSIIYSAQMQSYAIGIFSVSGLILILARINNLFFITKTQAIFIGLIIGFLCSAQYQVFIFLPGFLLAFIKYGKTEISNKVNSIIIGMIPLAIIIAILVFLPMKSHLVNNAAINWNAGINSEFAINQQDDFIQKLQGLLVQISNTPLIIQSMLSPVLENSYFATFFKILYTVFFIHGFILSFILVRHRWLFIFSFFAFLTWIILTGFGLLTYSPTRHSMVLIPIFVLFMTISIVYLLNKFFVEKIKFKLILSICIGILCLFLFNYAQLVNDRQDRFNENDINRVLIDYNVDYLFTGYENNAYFMKSVDYSPLIIDDSKKLYIFHKHKSYNKYESIHSATIAVFSRHKLSRDDLIIKYQLLVPYLNGLTLDALYILKKEEYFSNVEVDWSSLTKNGTNNYFLYVFKMSDN